MVAAIQLSIMSGATFGGLLLDHVSIAGPFIGGAVLLLLATAIVGDGQRMKPRVRLDKHTRLQVRTGAECDPKFPERTAQARIARSKPAIEMVAQHP